MCTVEVTVDDYSDPDEPVCRTVATVRLERHNEYPELYENPGHPVLVKTEEDLTIDLTCERPLLAEPAAQQKPERLTAFNESGRPMPDVSAESFLESTLTFANSIRPRADFAESTSAFSRK